MAGMSLFDEYTLEFEFLEPLLGTIPKQDKMYEEYIRDKTREAGGLTEAQQADETPPASIEEKNWTGFYQDPDGRPCLMDYQIKGFIKEAGNTVKDIVKVKNLRSKIDNTVFVYPRHTPLAEVVDGNLERPIRVMTMQGPRVSLMRSDFIEPGSTYTFDLEVLKGSEVTQEVLETVVSYGAAKGLGQWRNGGYGRFEGRITAGKRS